MKIAVTGANGCLGRRVAELCAEAGHSTVLIDRTDPTKEPLPNSETRKVDLAANYDDTLEALRGCEALIHLAAIPRPGDNPDWEVYSNNVQTAFNGFRACGELGIKKIAYASSVNAIGFYFSNQPVKYTYFPIDDDYPANPTDSYALAKLGAELQAKHFAQWFPGTKIACLRFHYAQPRKVIADDHAQDFEGSGLKNLWGWVHPQAVARACVLAVENADNFEGMEVFNIVAPDTTTSRCSLDVAKEHFPDVEIRGDWRLSANRSFWSTEKAEKLLRWKHVEIE